MLKISNNPTLRGLSLLCPGIVYSTATGTELTLDLLMPDTMENDTESRFPLVVFIQGSAWSFPTQAISFPSSPGFPRPAM